MPRYRNGYIPKSELVVFNTGWNSTDGSWYWGLPPATFDRHRKLLQIAQAHTGKILSPSQGWSTYRPYEAQVIAKRVHGIYAATPGTSSHGGYWEGKDVMAIDYHNWASVYSKYGSGARSRFYLDARLAGLTPGMIEPSRGYPDEPWHIVDLNPWSSGSVAGGRAIPIEDDMTPEQDQLLRNIAGFLYAGGTSAADPNFLGSPGTVYALLKTPVLRTLDGKSVKISQIQDNADTNSFVRQLLSRPESGAVTGEQIEALAVSIAEKVVSSLPEGLAPSAQDVALAVRSILKTDPLT